MSPSKGWHSIDLRPAQHLFDFTAVRVRHRIPIRERPSASATTVKAGQPLTIYGFGWGHGLGMSQYGAYQMAQNTLENEIITEKF